MSIAENKNRLCLHSLLVVGNTGGTHLGDSFARAANQLNLNTAVVNSAEAYNAPRWLRSINWHLLGRRPTRLKSFGRHVVSECLHHESQVMLAIGLAPLDKNSVNRIRQAGVITAIYLTDDPWNKAFSSSWFLTALVEYDAVFTPRSAHLPDLRELGCEQVFQIPFGYDGDLFHAVSNNEPKSSNNSIVFVGGADKDRYASLAPLVSAGFELDLYGGYWGRWPKMAKHWRGIVGPEELREITRTAAINLCLVRKSNRDGHVMRSFEIAACGGCMLVESTEEHRGIFGMEGDAVVYFSSPDEMVEKTRWLLNHPEERRRLSAAVHSKIFNGQNSYKDRLGTMLDDLRSLEWSQ